MCVSACVCGVGVGRWGVVTGMKVEQCFVSSVPNWHAHTYVAYTQYKVIVV